MPGLLLVALGFVAAALLAGPISRWVGLVFVSTTEHGGDFLGPPKRRLLWALPFVVLVHPMAYLVLALLVVTAATLMGRMASGWGWFLLGVYIYMGLVGITVLARLKRVRPRSTGRSDS